MFKNVKEIYKLIVETMEIANVEQTTFNLTVARGMGGFYNGVKGELVPSSSTC